MHNPFAPKKRPSSTPMSTSSPPDLIKRALLVTEQYEQEQSSSPLSLPSPPSESSWADPIPSAVDQGYVFLQQLQTLFVPFEHHLLYLYDPRPTDPSITIWWIDDLHDTDRLLEYLAQLEALHLERSDLPTYQEHMGIAAWLETRFYPSTREWKQWGWMPRAMSWIAETPFGHFRWDPALHGFPIPNDVEEALLTHIADHVERITHAPADAKPETLKRAVPTTPTPAQNRRTQLVVTAHLLEGVAVLDGVLGLTARFVFYLDWPSWALYSLFTVTFLFFIRWWMVN